MERCNRCGRRKSAITGLCICYYSPRRPIHSTEIWQPSAVIDVLELDNSALRALQEIAHPEIVDHALEG